MFPRWCSQIDKDKYSVMLRRVRNSTGWEILIFFPALETFVDNLATLSRVCSELTLDSSSN